MSAFVRSSDFFICIFIGWCEILFFFLKSQKTHELFFLHFALYCSFLRWILFLLYFILFVTLASVCPYFTRRGEVASLIWLQVLFGVLWAVQLSTSKYLIVFWQKNLICYLSWVAFLLTFEWFLRIAVLLKHKWVFWILSHLGMLEALMTMVWSPGLGLVFRDKRRQKVLAVVDWLLNARTLIWLFKIGSIWSQLRVLDILYLHRSPFALVITRDIRTSFLLMMLPCSTVRWNFLLLLKCRKLTRTLKASCFNCLFTSLYFGVLNRCYLYVIIFDLV